MTMVKWWLVAVYGLLAGAITLAALYLLKIEPIYSWFPLVPSYISTSLSKLNIMSLITNNWGAILTFGVPIAGLAVAVLKTKLSEAATKKALEAQTKLTELAKTDASTAITNAKTSASAEVVALKEKLAKYENDTDFNEAQNIISSQQTKINDLTKQVETLTQIKTTTPEQIQQMIQEAKLQNYK
jgi:hypothetical protein